METSFPETGPAAALLTEVRHALAALVEHGTEAIIDLGALPLAPADIDALDAAFGTGEVTARVEACGTVALRETRYAGLWRVDHLGPDGRNPTARFLEITTLPQLLRTPPEDAAASLAALDRHLGGP